MRRPRKRFVAIAVLIMLALLRVESIHAHMQGHLRAPGRILRLEQWTAGFRVHLLGWVVELPPDAAQALALTPSRIREGVSELIEGVTAAVRSWRLSRR